MKMKINRYEFDVTNKDIVMDNGAIYQCLTLKHASHPTGSYTWITNMIPTIMSKKQFKELLKINQLILLDRDLYPNTYLKYNKILDNKIVKLYRFNVKE